MGVRLAKKAGKGMDRWRTGHAGDVGMGRVFGVERRTDLQDGLRQGLEKSGLKSPFYVAPREESVLCVFSQFPALSNIFSPSCLV